MVQLQQKQQQQKGPAGDMAKATALFSSSGGYALAEGVQLPGKRDVEKEKDTEKTGSGGDTEEGGEVRGGKVKTKSAGTKGRKRDLKAELRDSKGDLRGAVSDENFVQIDEPESVQNSLDRFKEVKRGMKNNPVTKEEAEDSRLALRRLKEIRKGYRKGDTKLSEKELQDTRLLGEHFQNVKNTYDMDKRELHLERLEEKTGPLNYVEESFFLKGKTPAKDMEKVLEVSRELEKSRSSYKIEGNSVEPLEGKEIWQRKMKLLDSAIEETKKQKGKSSEVNLASLEVDAEYYELGQPDMLNRLKTVADGGGKVRVLMDAGRLAYKEKGVMDANQIAYRLESLSELQDGPHNKNMGVVLYPTKEQLGSTGELMHRKLLRVGDKVILGGMNANSASGENIDYGKEIEGPAAKRLTEIFKRDVSDSTGRSVEDIYGKNQFDIIKNGETVNEKTGEKKKYDVTLPAWGMKSLFKSAIPAEKREEVLNKNLPEEKQIDGMLLSLAEKGIDPTKVAEFPDANKDGNITSSDVKKYLLSGDKGGIKLTGEGRELLAGEIERRVGMTNSSENKKQLEDISTPDGSIKGKDTLSIGDLPEERQAILLNTINSADKFIHIPAFVVTKDVAETLVAKKQEMVAAGKDIDIKVVLDPGKYPHGGTPNEAAYKILEDNKIPVRWALLDRTGEHDRKVHSKMIVTDKAILSGSTNFSGKGMRDNWEMSDVTYINEKDPESLSKRDQFEGDFQRLWNKESIDINTKELAEKKFAGDNSPDVHIKKNEYRDSLMRKSIQYIEDYEKGVGKEFSALAETPQAKSRIEELTSQGMHKGYATLEALSDVYPSEKLDGIRKGTAGWKRLAKLSSEGI